MAVVCPTITANDNHDYRAQMERLKPFAARIHIDLMDGKFAPTVSPALNHVWWPGHMTADIHLMYRRPGDYLDQLVELKPHLVIIHYEADVRHMDFAARLHAAGIEAGLALLHDTSVSEAEPVMHSFDHILVFSGHLGYHGGQADLHLLDKVQEIHRQHHGAEIGWDGGITDRNAGRLVDAGVDVLDVGGYLQNGNAEDAFNNLNRIVGSAE